MPEMWRQAASVAGSEVVGPPERRQADEGLAISLSLHGCRLDEPVTRMPTKKLEEPLSFRQMMSTQLLSEFGGMCAWRGCSESFKGNMPDYWRRLLTYHCPKSVIDPFERADIDQDCAICPEHVRQFDNLLKVLPDRPSRAGATESSRGD